MKGDGIDEEGNCDNESTDKQITQLGIGQFDQYERRSSWESGVMTIFKTVREYARFVGRGIFGDRLGLILFCAALAFYALYWRVGIFINDTFAVANGFVAVSEGQLYIERAVYGPGLDTPGTFVIEGVTYARNYGQVVLALPFLWIIQSVDIFADLRVALAGGWCLLLLGLSVMIGSLIDREVFGRDSRSVASFIGSVAALGAFGVILYGSTPIDPVWHHLLALQIQMMVAAALVGVMVYRLLNRIHGRQIGLAAGTAVVFTTPIGFWASIPKRHVLVALGFIISTYCLLRSREALYDEPLNRKWRFGLGSRSVAFSEMTSWRTLAYLPVGILAWINALEGLLLLIALLTVDVPTSVWRIRSLVTTGFACIVSLLPMFVTNIIIAGNPFEPPSAFVLDGGGGVAKQSGRGGSTTNGPDGGIGSSQTIDSFLGVLHKVNVYMQDGVSVVTSELDKVFYTFIRSGYVTEPHIEDAMRLSFVESMPLATVLIAIPLGLWRSNVYERIRVVIKTRRLSSVATVDAFVSIYALSVVFVYLPRFPMKAELTVRYLLVLFPIAVYGIARISSVRRIVVERWRVCLVMYLISVLVGGQVFFLYLYMTDAVVDEFMQAYAHLGLGIALIMAGWVFTNARGYQTDTYGAISLGLAAAAGTVFVLIARLWYFAYTGPFALPLV